jgi:hypothetical protein
MVEPIKIQIALADLLDVINAHSNPTIATAILDGTYENPIDNLDYQPRYNQFYFTKNDDDTRDHYQLFFNVTLTTRGAVKTPCLCKTGATRLTMTLWRVKSKSKKALTGFLFFATQY